MSEKIFSFKFTGDNAEELAERFLAYFWDGGLDQTIESDFLSKFGLDLEDVSFEDEGYTAGIDTSKAK
ncbi:MAG: hypothetical protein ACRCZO_17905 [Cetobacterium sp.]